MIPDFMKTKYFVPETDNWHLTDDAPPEVVKEFEEWKKEQEQAQTSGVILD